MAKEVVADSVTQFKVSRSKWVRVLAGPGAGKTYNIKERLMYLVKDAGVSPDQILVLSFTSVAAQDLRASIDKLGLGPIEVSTLHSLALRIIEKEKKNIRLMSNFEKDTMLRDLEPDIGIIGSKQNKMKGLLLESDFSTNDISVKTFKDSLEKWKFQHPSLYLDDLIPYVCNLLEHNASAKKRSSFDCIIVDEYQDLNPNEQRFVELLLSKRGNLAVIGDDDQSIYGFKGAAPTGIKEFVNTHDGCEDIQFSLCWRCPTDIIKYANALIANNDDRIEKTLEAKKGFQKGACELLSSETPNAEIERICQIVREEIEHGVDPNEIVILTPIKDRGKKLYLAMNDNNIPTSFCFRDAVFDDEKTRENISLLSLAANPRDLVSWRYLLGCGSKERKAKSYRYIRKYADSEHMNILDVLEQCATGRIRVEYRYTRELIKRYIEINNQLKAIEAHPQWLIDSIKATDESYASILESAFSEKFSMGGFEAVRRLVIDELFSPEATAANGKVRIMSLHASKGLSANLVIIMSAVDGFIPSRKSSIAEQRRLFYVAITRCKGGEPGRHPGKVIISWYNHSEDLITDRQVTRFVSEMGYRPKEQT